MDGEHIEIITILKERILLAEKKKGEYDTLEMDAFWDGQMRCAQDMLNKVSRLTKRVPDGAEVCAECGFPPSHHDPSCYVRRKSPRR